MFYRPRERIWSGSSWKSLGDVAGVRCWRSPVTYGVDGRLLLTVLKVACYLRCWRSPVTYGVDGRLLLMAVKSLYSFSEDCVPLDGVKSQPFSVGLRQWCVLTPLLFIVYIRVLHTTSPGPNSTYEAISPGRKTHFANNEKITYSRKMCWLGRMEHIPKKSHYAKCSTLELLCNSLCGLSQKSWRALIYMNWIDSHRRVDKGVTIGNYRMNHLRFAGKLVLHAWILSTGSSAGIW